MNFDIDLLQDLLNDTTESQWEAVGTKICITTLSGNYDYCNVKSRGDAAFIAYVKTHAQEIIDYITDCRDGNMAETFCKLFGKEEDLDKLLDRLDEFDGFGDDE